MVTDRTSTAGLIAILTTKTTNQHLQLALVLLLVLDISSHWAQMVYANTTKTHHKEMKDGLFLVRLFYSSYPFFGYLCVGAELTYVALYMLLVSKDDFMTSVVATYLLYVCVPACAMKQIVNIAQLSGACWGVAAYDADTYNNKEK